MLLAVTTAKLAGARTLIGASWSGARQLEDARVAQLQLAPHYYSRASSTRLTLPKIFRFLSTNQRVARSTRTPEHPE